MTSADAHDAPSSTFGRISAATLLVVIIVLALFPPETRGGALGFSALCIALAALVAWPRAGSRRALIWVVGLGLAIPPVWSLATSPGVALPPLIVLYVAVGAGIVAATVRRDLLRARAVPAALAVLGTIVAVHGVWQAGWGLERAAALLASDPAIPDREAVLARLASGRAFAGFSTPAALGGYLALSIPITVALALSVRRPVVRGALAGAAVLQLAGLVATASFTAVAALLGAMVVAAALHPAGRRVLLGTTLAVATIAVAILWVRGAEIADLDHRNNPLVLRAGNMRIALEMASDHPYRGLGPGGFGEAYPSYRGEADNASRHVHNVPLEWVVEFGIPAGAALGATFLILFVGPAWWPVRRDAAWIRGAEIGLMAFAFQNLVDFTALMPSVLWTAAVLRGAIARPRTAPTMPRPVLGAAAAGGLMAVAVLAGLHGVSWNARHAARSRIVDGDLAVASRLAARAAALAPWDSDAAQLLLTTRLAAASRPVEHAWLLAEAMPLADRVVDGVPLRPSARAVRATVREAVGDRAGAYADLAFAVDAYPSESLYLRERDRLGEALGYAAGGPP